MAEDYLADVAEGSRAAIRDRAGISEQVVHGMDEDRRNFQAWYADILQSLYSTRAGGIAVLMISTPLLERYLRQKNGRTPEQSLDDSCMETLRSVFPALVDTATARKFWGVYRNGFLHQATLSLKTRGGVPLPAGSLTHDESAAIRVNADGSFVLHPELFSRQVVKTIEGDFPTFVGTGNPGPRPPQVVAYASPASSPLDTSNIVLSTESRR